MPQHLELDDVVVFGLSATDLLYLVGGSILGWWLYVALPIDVAVRVVGAGASAAAGSLFGIARVDGRSARAWIVVLLAFVVRPRVLRIGGRA